MLLRFGIAATALLAAVTFARLGFPHLQMCGLKLMTGFPCPGCGMTRSVVALGRPDMIGSLRMHPLGVVLVGSVLALGVGAALGLARGRDPVWDLYARKGHVLMVSLVTALLVVWIVRIFVVPGWSPDPITPGGLWVAR